MNRRVRGIVQRGFARLDAAQRRALTIKHGDPLAGQFAAFGRRSQFGYPWTSLVGPASVSIGDNTLIRSFVAIEALSTPDKVVLRFGDHVHVGHYCRFVALNGIDIEDEVGFGHLITVADTIHEWKTAEEDAGFVHTPLKVGRPLRIERAAWIGNNCVITGGITIGARSIIVPNSVINRDVPPETMVGGNPARVLRRLTASGWEWVVDPSTVELDVRQASEER